ncbi:YeeE/YedE family protein [Methanocalculus chunghsingensis]|uniref:YeeE/YedE family protein n=1 Tax=Methanocalculus chunghsingensis TaxID=156457 RepID=A0A8J7W613_9EURY|nr:YeeE/YedE thiosulfate transporter family protein [Methanocalculus chunghsingensis]MBR1368971.1 YeeE/YedE family protein [Methanocalculus chunghsingensis]
MTFDTLRSDTKAQMVLGLLSGIVFGFLLQKGGVTEYGVIIGQLLLTDFTVVKVMLSAVLVGMIGVYTLKWMGLANLHYKVGSVGSTIIGGLIFGAGFGILGYCPGTAAGAVGSGAMDAAIGMIGIAIGAGIFARLYPRLNRSILNKGIFPAETIPELVGIRSEVLAVGIVAVLVAGILYLLHAVGL